MNRGVLCWDCYPIVVDAVLATIADPSRISLPTSNVVVAAPTMKKIVPCGDRQIFSLITDLRVAAGERPRTTANDFCDGEPRSLIAAKSTAAVDC